MILVFVVRSLSLAANHFKLSLPGHCNDHFIKWVKSGLLKASSYPVFLRPFIWRAFYKI